MTIGTQTQPFTPDDLLRLSDEGRYELVDGKLVEKPMAKKSNAIAAALVTELGIFLKKSPLARLYNEQPFQCFGQTGDPTRVRKPDVSVVLTERVAADAQSDSFFRIPPDIAIEVTSPNDLVYALQEKLEDYGRAGVPLVWVIYPDTRTIEVRRRDGSINILHEDDLLTGEPVLAGFAVRVGELFPPR